MVPAELEPGAGATVLGSCTSVTLVIHESRHQGPDFHLGVGLGELGTKPGNRCADRGDRSLASRTESKTRKLPVSSADTRELRYRGLFG